MINKFNFRIIFLIIVILFAALLRIYKISENPPSLSWDEVSIGYNAYSILKTGRDEHGRFLPLDTFTAFGDYKPPVPIYMTVPFVAIFGLNELSVRLPSALMGVMAVVFIYFLVIELINIYFPNKPKSRHYSSIINYQSLPYIIMLMLAVSPWHINLSRAGFEANISLTFILAGLYLVLKSVIYPKYWIYAWIPFVLSFYTFNSTRYMVPLLGLYILIAFRKNVLENKKYIAFGLMLAFLMMIPVIPHVLSKEARLRFTEVNIFTDSSVIEASNRRIEEEGNNILSRIIHNRRVGFIRSYFIHFFDNLDPQFLFVNGDGNPKFSTRDLGQMYLIDAVFITIGFIYLGAVNPSLFLFLVFWVISGIFPAGMARETPHALRTLNILPVFYIFSGFGIYSILNLISRSKSGLISLFSITGIAVLYFAIFTYYIYNYYVHYPVEYAGEWQYGYKQAISYVGSENEKYDQVFVSDIIGRPYMYTLFYLKYDPVKYLSEKMSYFDAAGFYHVDGFGKFVFSEDKINSGGKVLYVDSKPPGIGAVELHRVILPNGFRLLSIYEI